MKKIIKESLNSILNLFIFFISFRGIQFIFDFFLHFILKIKGFKNFGNFKLSGEECFLKMINKYNLDTSLDVGANTGAYTEKIINLTGSKVISFEPSKDSFKELKKLKKKFPKLIAIYNVALSNKNKILNFYSIGKNSQLASFEKNISNFSYIKKKKYKG